MTALYSALFLLLLLERDQAVPLEDKSKWIKDLILPLQAVENSSVPTIPFLWHFKDKSYYVGSIAKLNFLESEQFCSYHGMRLLSITSSEENVFLGEKITDYGFADTFWTSGTRAPDDEHWVWLTTGSRIDFTNWAPDEPNNDGNLEKCIEVNRVRIATKKHLFWNDCPCEAKLYFICEYKRPKNISYVIDRLNKTLNSTDMEVIEESKVNNK